MRGKAPRRRIQGEAHLKNYYNLIIGNTGGRSDVVAYFLSPLKKLGLKYDGSKKTDIYLTKTEKDFIFKKIKKSQAKIIAIQPSDDHGVMWPMRNFAKLIGALITREPSTYSVLKGKTVDFAFIDGNHSFGAVVKDTKNILEFTRPKSIIFWHDFTGDKSAEVIEALYYMAQSGKLKIFHIDTTSLAVSIL